MNCFSLEQLLQVVSAGSLAADVERHVLDCERCGRRWKLAAEAFDLLSDSSLEERFPDHLRRALLAIPTSDSSGATTELIAHAIPEPGGRAPIRASTHALPIHHLYRIGDYEVDLCLDEEALLGQVLPRAATDDPTPWVGAYCLIYGESDVRSCEIGPNGEFDLADVAPGSYDMAIEASGLRLVLRGISLDGASGER